MSAKVRAIFELQDYYLCILGILKTRWSRLRRPLALTVGTGWWIRCNLERIGMSVWKRAARKAADKLYAAGGVRTVERRWECSIENGSSRLYFRLVENLQLHLILVTVDRECKSAIATKSRCCYCCGYPPARIRSSSSAAVQAVETAAVMEEVSRPFDLRSEDRRGPEIG